MRLATFNWILVLLLGLSLAFVLVFALQDPFALLAIGMFSLIYFGWTLALALAVGVYLYHRKRHAQGLGIAMAILSFVMMLPVGGMIFMTIYALWHYLID